MNITVNPLWLSSCGRQSHIGIPFRVLHVADHGKRGKMYEVLDKDGYPWVVWSKRGVHEHQESAA
jgi:hypothetical protein